MGRTKKRTRPRSHKRTDERAWEKTEAHVQHFTRRAENPDQFFSTDMPLAQLEEEAIEWARAQGWSDVDEASQSPAWRARQIINHVRHNYTPYTVTLTRCTADREVTSTRLHIIANNAIIARYPELQDMLDDKRKR